MHGMERGFSRHALSQPHVNGSLLFLRQGSRVVLVFVTSNNLVLFVICYLYIQPGKGTVRSCCACHSDWWPWKGGCLPWLLIGVFCKIPDGKLVRAGSAILWRTSRHVETFHLRCVKKTMNITIALSDRDHGSRKKSGTRRESFDVQHCERIDVLTNCFISRRLPRLFLSWKS